MQCHHPALRQTHMNKIHTFEKKYSPQCLKTFKIGPANQLIVQDQRTIYCSRRVPTGNTLCQGFGAVRAMRDDPSELARYKTTASGIQFGRKSREKDKSGNEPL